MKNENEKIIAAVNDLVVINHDRTDGYTKAAEESRKNDLADLSELFTTYAFKSKGYSSVLAARVRTLGGEPAEGTKETGKLYRVWMDIKAALASNDRKAVLSSCEYGEDVALQHYSKVLDDNDLNLPADIRMVLEEQRREIETSHDHVKILRDSTQKVS